MASMLVYTVSASLYVVALCLATTLLVRVQRNASRESRIAHSACGVCCAAAIVAALAATLSGLWALAVALCGFATALSGIWLRLAFRSVDTDTDDGDDSDEDGGGGRLRRPIPPAPSLPPGDPPDWGRFDRARAAWERSRDPAGV